MSIIIPYQNDLYDHVGAFITPDGKILHVKDDHESFCDEYIYSIRKLAKLNSFYAKQWELYKAWKKQFNNPNSATLSDFMVMVLLFDKVEALSKYTITTPNIQPHIRFYNYYLMDWNINVFERLIFDQNTKQFRELPPHPLGLDHEDTEAYYEIEDIKQRTLRNEIPLFFK